MPRAKEFDPITALDAAVEVFWATGYDKTSLDELVACMHVGRQSLYDTFGDKRALYLAALHAYRSSTQAAMQRLFRSGRPMRECVEAILMGIARESRANHQRGCLLLSANLERSSDDREISALVKRNQVECEALFTAAFLAAQQRGEIAPQKDPAALASFFIATLQGMRAMARAASDRKALERIARVALSTLD